MEDIATYLQSKGCIVKAAGAAEVHTHCFFHEEADDRPGRLYIHVGQDEAYGAFKCFVCGAKGGFNVIRKHFGDPTIGNSNPDAAQGAIPDEIWMSIQAEASTCYQQTLQANPEVWNYLIEVRGLVSETILKFGLGWAEGGLITHLVQKGFDLEDIKATGLVNKDGRDHLYQRITIPYIMLGATVQIRGRAHGNLDRAKYLSPQGPRGYLFNHDAVIGDAKTGPVTKAMVTEGEFNCMHLAQLGYAAVGVPGANTWKDSWTSLFDECRRVFVIFDMYDLKGAGEAGAETVSAKLGSRARIVSLPEALPGQPKIDVNEWVVKYGKGKDDIDFLCSKAGGGSLISVAQAHERWLEIEGNQNIPQLRFNVQALDEAMEFGLMPGQVVVVAAKSGAGKTRGALNIFQRMAMTQPDIRILNISLEQTRNEYFETANRIYDFYSPGSTDLDTVNFWSDKIQMVDKNRVSIDELNNSICQYLYEYDRLDMMCLDYLGYYANSYPGDEYTRMSRAIMDLKQLAKEHQIVIYCLSQAGRAAGYGEELSGAEVRGSGVIEETADVHLAFWASDQRKGISLVDHTGIADLKLLKSRNGGVHSQATFKYAPLSRVLMPLDDPLIAKVDLERHLWRGGRTWKEAKQILLDPTGPLNDPLVYLEP